MVARAAVLSLQECRLPGERRGVRVDRVKQTSCTDDQPVAYAVVHFVC